MGKTLKCFWFHCCSVHWKAFFNFINCWNFRIIQCVFRLINAFFLIFPPKISAQFVTSFRTLSDGMAVRPAIFLHSALSEIVSLVALVFPPPHGIRTESRYFKVLPELNWAAKFYEGDIVSPDVIDVEFRRWRNKWAKADKKSPPHSSKLCRMP